MSVTFSGAFTFNGGGLTLTLPPSTNPTAGWFFGGSYGGAKSLVNRITFATDTATASVRGPLSSAVGQLAGAGNTTDGWGGGGNGPVSTVQRITYATDTATASVRGPLSSAIRYQAATGTSSYGWFGGGLISGVQTTVSRITYASDTDTASARGSLSSARYGLAASTDGTTYGWFGGGGNGSGVQTSIVDRIIYATDTSTATARGPLGEASILLGGTSTTTYGWFAGGQVNYDPYYLTLVSRITYATDTATASLRGPLNQKRSKLAGVGNDTYGYFGGGDDSPYRSTIERITYATDTNNATVVGPMSTTNTNYAGTSGIQ